MCVPVGKYTRCVFEPVIDFTGCWQQAVLVYRDKCIQGSTYIPVFKCHLDVHISEYITLSLVLQAAGSRLYKCIHTSEWYLCTGTYELPQRQTAFETVHMYVLVRMSRSDMPILAYRHCIFRPITDFDRPQAVHGTCVSQTENYAQMYAVRPYCSHVHEPHPP